MSYRKHARWLALGVIASTLLSACSSGGGQTNAGADQSGAASGNTSAKPVDSAKPVTLKFWRAGNEVSWHDYWLKTIQAFEADHPNIKIEYAEAPFGNDIDTKLNVAYASGSSPDIISHALVSIASRASKGQYEPLDSYVNAWPDKSDIADNFYNFGKYKDKLYGLPIYPTPFLVAYRKDFFKEAGLDPEKPPVTWAELADAAVKLTKRDGNLVTRSGLNMPIDDHMLLIPFAIQQGGKYTLNDKPNLDSPEFIKALNFLTDLYRNKKVAIETTAVKERQQPLFVQGKAAISNMTPTQILDLIKSDPSMKDKIGFIQLKEQRPAIWSGMEFLFMSSESPHKKEAAEFLQYAMSSKAMWDRYKATNAAVVRTSLKDKYIQDNPFINKAIFDNIGNGVANPPLAWAPIGIKYTQMAISEAYYGKKTPEQALKDAQKTIISESGN